MNVILFRVVSTLCFTAILLLSYGLHDPTQYQYRDDGVITMSVGRNLIDFGFLGVSPSGPRVEASSSPLQTFVYAGAYALTGLNYSTYSWLQTSVATFVVGWILSLFFQPGIKSFAMLMLGALSLSFLYPFFFWHASGMENALTHVLFLLTIYLLYRFDRDQKISYSAGFLIFLATLCRLDSMIYIGPMLAFYSAYSFKSKRSIEPLWFSIFVFACWIAFNLWRSFYFGGIVPNTARAQGISIDESLVRLITFDAEQWKTGFEFSIKIFMRHGGWLLFLLIPIHKGISADLRRYNLRFVWRLALILVIIGSLSPYLFGESRIDPYRTTSYLAICIVLLMMLSVIHRPANELRRWLFYALPLTIVVFALGAKGPYMLGWPTEGFENLRLILTREAEKNNIHRATISNPDLGALSWHKQFNIVDLGRLGSPVMAQLKDDPDGLKAYYLDYVQPDFIAAHSPWLDWYCESVFDTERFDELYVSMGSGLTGRAACRSTSMVSGIWIRRDIQVESSSPERALLDDLQLELNAQRIRDELARCKANSISCEYVARTVFRFVPELRKAGELADFANLFEDPLDRAFLYSFQNSLEANQFEARQLAAVK